MGDWQQGGSNGGGAAGQGGGDIEEIMWEEIMYNFFLSRNYV